MLRFIACLAFVSPLLAEPLDSKIFEEAARLADEAGQAHLAGKTVKADRLRKQAEAVLAKYVKPGKVFSFPEGCPFSYNSVGQTVEAKCEPFSLIMFFAEAKDKTVLEQLEECKGSCTGEFSFAKNLSGKMFSVSGYGQGPVNNVSVKLKFRKVTLEEKP